MNPNQYVKDQILNFIADDALDFPFAYGFAAEALREEDHRTTDVLDLIGDVLLELMKKEIIAIGDITGGVDNFVPWEGSPEAIIRKLKEDVTDLGIENIGDREFVCWILDKKRLVNELSH